MVAQTQKRCGMQEKDMKEEIERLRHKVDEETRVNAEIESYLRTHQTVSLCLLSLKRIFWDTNNVFWDTNNVLTL